MAHNPVFVIVVPKLALVREVLYWQSPTLNEPQVYQPTTTLVGPSNANLD